MGLKFNTGQAASGAADVIKAGGAAADHETSTTDQTTWDTDEARSGKDKSEHRASSALEASINEYLTRDLYLLSYDAGLFARHWAIWVPNEGEQLHQGKHPLGTLIQVVGDPLSGFQHDFVQDDAGPYGYPHPWARVLGSIVDGPVTDMDQAATNRLEDIAIAVAPPQPSMNPASSSGKRVRRKLQNCQDWIQWLVDELISREMIDRTAQKVIDECPR